MSPRRRVDPCGWHLPPAASETLHASATLRTAPERLLFNALEVAEMLGVTESWVRKATADGRLRPVRLGRNVVRYRRQDVEALIDKFRESAAGG